MKICNFLRFDPDYNGVGLSRGNKLEKEVWDTYYDNPSLLKEVALRIKSIGNNDQLQNNIKFIEIGETEEASEGKILLKLHKYRERSQSIVRKKKSLEFQCKGFLECEVCGFNFEKHYGEYGQGFIECHHKTPLHKLPPNRKTLLDDLSLICSNCHRIIHRIKPMPSIQELRKIVSSKGVQ